MKVPHLFNIFSDFIKTDFYGTKGKKVTVCIASIVNWVCSSKENIAKYYPQTNLEIKFQYLVKIKYWR